MSTRVRAAGATAIALLVLGAGAACASERDEELDYLDRVRNAYPTLSVDQLSDDRLLELANLTCGPKSFGADDRAELESLDVDPDRLAELALPLCPTR